MDLYRTFPRVHGGRVAPLREIWFRCSATALALLGTVGITALVATNPAAASGTARYVAQGGSDTSNDCTSPTTPCATVSHAVSQANSGDTINVAGTIDDHVTIATSLTIGQWPSQPTAVVDGTHSGVVITISSGAVTMNQLTIQHGSNTSGVGGGGIYLIGPATLTLNDSTISNNSAGSAGGGPGALGGGIENNAGTLTVNNSTISDNTSYFEGGGVDNQGTLNVNDSTFSGNTATSGGAGGGLSNAASATVTDSTFAANSADTLGGGIENGSFVQLIDSTLSGNTSGTGQGGGIGSGANSHMGATIVAGNTGGNCLLNQHTSLGYNLTNDTNGSACGFTQPTDVVNANPNLGALANNGGPTETMLPPSNSPAAFVIPNPTTLSGGFQVCPRTDQRGVSSHSGAKCTIGAVEAPSILYVAQAGTDTSNNCISPANPCATISNAVSQANSGDTINVSGTIDDHVTIATSLTIGQWFNQPQAVVDGTGSGVPFTINSGTVTFNRLVIQHGFNSSTPADGGGIYDNGFLTLNNTTVSNNTTAGGGLGGGVFIAGGGPGLDGTLTLNNTKVSNNTAGAGGGGIENQDGETLTVKNSTISDNVGGSTSGGIDNSGTLSVDNSTVSGNTGTGIGNEQNLGHATVNDSTIANNSSNGGPGGIFEQGGTASFTLTNSTVSGNVSVSTAGGIENAGSITVAASIVAGNTVGGNCSGNASSSLGYNLTDDSTGTACGLTQSTDVVNANPNLGALGNNGGPTETMLPPSNSPAAFVIPNPTTLGTTQVCPRTDQRGEPSSGACTIGAVEAIPGVAPSLPSGQSHTWTTGQNSMFTINASGTPPPTITYPYGQPGSGKIPNGLTLSTSPGSATISGKPAANAGGTYNIKLVADNGVSPSSTQTVTLVVQQPPVMSLPKNGGTVGFKAGVASSVPWSVTAPATTWSHITQPVTYTTGLPGGVSFNNNGNGTGTLSGTLAKGTYGPMSIKAQNVAGSSTTTFFIKAQ